MELVNLLPLPALAFRQFDQRGMLDCVVSARGTFIHVQDGSLQFSDEQEPFQWTDAYEGDPHRSIMLRQSDLVPEKRGTDITFIGKTYSPEGAPAPSWTCSLAVGPIRKSLLVSGLRQWVPVFSETGTGLLRRQKRRNLEAWRLTAPEPATESALDWTRAAGGSLDGGELPEELDERRIDFRNPLGCGHVSDANPENAITVDAPTVTAPEDDIANWRIRHEPRGFGPIPPWWPQRSRHAGTYDDEWISSRHPLLPEDFNPLFWQCAPEDQIAIPHIRPGTAYELMHLDPVHRKARGFIPEADLAVKCETEQGHSWHPAHLDGIHFDWRADNRVLLTWRARFPLPEAEGARLTLANVKYESDTGGSA